MANWLRRLNITDGMVEVLGNERRISMLTAEQFIYKLMEATEESYPEVSSVCFDFLENLSDCIEADVSLLALPSIEQGCIPPIVVLKAANAGCGIMVQHDLLQCHIEYHAGGEWKHVCEIDDHTDFRYVF